MSAWPFHAGELEAQRLAGGGPGGSGIRPAMPDQHRIFFAQLPFVVVGAVDERGPLATMLAGPPGFVAAPDPVTLRIAASPDPDDPATAALRPGAPAGVLGIELHTRRRNRANGVVAAVDAGALVLDVIQSFGNCPKYIHPRVPVEVLRAGAPTRALARLAPDVLAAVTRADTFFVASSAHAGEATGGVDVSHRAGPPGFVHVEGDRLTIPDYRGNRYFNTLGNLVADPRAGLLFVDFRQGDLWQLAGTTEIVWSGPEVAALPGAERLWRLHVERAWHRPAAIPLRWVAP